MKLFQKFNKSSIGIDIGTYNAKAVQLTKNQHGIKLDAYSNTNINNTDIENEKEFYKLISQLLAQEIYGKFSAQNILVSLPQEMVLETIVSFEKNNLLSTKKNIENELRSNYNLNTNQFFIDYELLGKSQIKSTAVIYTYAVVCIPLTFFYSLQEQLNKQEFVSLRCLPKFAAVSKGFVKKQKPLLLLDLGYENSYFYFSDGKRFIHAKIDFSSKKLGQIIHNALDIDQKNLSYLFTNVGLQNNDLGNEIKTASNQYLAQLYNELSANIKKIDPFLDDQIIHPPTLQVGGNLASMPQLIEHISKNIKLNTEIANPWQKVPVYPLKPMPKTRNPQYMHAIGLSLLGIS